MTNRLDAILAVKQLEVQALYALIAENPHHPIAQVLKTPTKRANLQRFKASLSGNGLSLIAEVKRCSPSAGLFAPELDATKCALDYVQSGANAISVLTDEQFFRGSLHDLTQVVQRVRTYATPILRLSLIHI